VSLIPLRQIPDDRGKVMHMLKRTDPHFTEFGEIYFSSIFPGVVKGWHLHKKMVIHYAVVTGMIKLVLFDEREGSPSKGVLEEHYLGDANYSLCIVPPGVWNGFKGMGVQTALVANCASIPHDPEEIVRLDPHKSHIAYDWSVKDR
jgi:dTDP-4-dehydrorhamnose 3,5-epimerase